MFQKRPYVFPPPPDVIASGIKLVSRIASGTKGRVGAVSDENGSIRWRYRPHQGDSWTTGNPLRKPDFVFFERDERDALKMCRVLLFPSVFNLLEEGNTIGKVRMSSVLRKQVRYRTRRLEVVDIPHAALHDLLLWRVDNRDRSLGRNRTQRESMEHPSRARTP